MTPIEKKKLEAELAGVGAARQALELRIMEREEEITNIKDMIEKQTKREQEIKELLS